MLIIPINRKASPVIDMVKEATRDLFRHIGSFDDYWKDGWRPVLEKGGDILFISCQGSYTRCRKDEWGDRFAFLFLTNEYKGETVADD